MKPRNHPDLAHHLICHAARKAPQALSERLEEEWLADLQSRSGALARLRLALGCCWATGIITHDFRVPQLAASAASAAHRPLLAVLRHDLPQLSRRTLTFILIAGLHVLLIYGFASGFAQHVVAALPERTHAEFIEETRPPPPPPVKTAIRLTQVRFTDQEFPVPQNIVYPTDDALSGGPPGPPERPQDPPVVRAVTRIMGGPGKGFPATADYYPDASRRIAETGAANVQVCVDPQGRLTADPVIARSSGSRRIDAAALKLATAGSGHYRPTTEDGAAVSACYPYRIRFELNN